MGIIDSTSYTLACPKCGTRETRSVHDKGSNWGGSHWQSSTSFTHFDTNWQGGGGREEPALTSALCKACGAEAVVT
jgi:hypothetical protein